MLDAVLILGKEIRRDPDRARRELKARAAAATIAHRHLGLQAILSLEAPLRDQPRAGSQIVADDLKTLGVSRRACLFQQRSRSTREEAVLSREIVRQHRWRALLVITSSYHLARARWIFGEHFGCAAQVCSPEVFADRARPQELRWIVRGIPSAAVMQREGRVERRLAGMASAIGWLPDRIRWEMEIAAGATLRASTDGRRGR